MKRTMIYKRFERFWHWCQAGLIFFLMFTGFEIHGSYTVLGFGKAAQLHEYAAYALLGLWVLAIFWHLTTGEWKQYIPTTDKLGAVAYYYLIGTFTGAEHPYRATSQAKHNPLQRLAYLGFKLVISPAPHTLTLKSRSGPKLPSCCRTNTTGRKSRSLVKSLT